MAIPVFERCKGVSEGPERSNQVRGISEPGRSHLAAYIPKGRHDDSDFSSNGETFGLERVNIEAQLGTLRKLQALAEEIRRQSSDQDTTISFQPAWFWDLLDPRIFNSMQNVPQDFNQTSADRPGHSDDSRICLKSHFVMPLDENQRLNQERQPSDPNLNTGDSLFIMPEDLELFDIDSLSFDFLHNGSWEPGL